MYDAGMITMENQGRDKMSNATEYGVVKIGQNITATRKDGRVFEGGIVNVRAYAKGTMVTLQYAEESFCYDNYSGMDVKVKQSKYKNVYLEDCATWVVWENDTMYWKV